MNNLENLYREVILEHYKNPRNKGLVTDGSYTTVHIKNPSCGDDITIQTKIAGGNVTDCRHEGKGCSICCSSASVLSETVIGKTVENARIITENYLKMVSNKPYDSSIDLEEAQVYAGVNQFPARVKCASIAWQAFLQTLEKK
jgi:SUF system NifU family Fe-S assembly protein